MKNNEIRKILNLKSTQYLSNIKSKEPDRFKVLVRHATLLKKLSEMTEEERKEWHDKNRLFNICMNLDIGDKLEGIRLTMAKHMLYEQITKKV